MDDNTLNQFRLRLAQINGIKVNQEKIHEAAITQPKQKSYAQKSLTDLWHEHSDAVYDHDQGGSGVSEDGKKTAAEIEKHVRKHYGPKVVNDMKKHSSHVLTHAEYSSNDYYKGQAEELRKKHNIGERD